MNVDDIRNILMVQAVEESDEGEQLLTSTEKRDAATASGAPLGKQVDIAGQNSFLASRAESLLRRLSSSHPEATTLLEQPPAGSPLGMLSITLGLVAAVVGFLTNELGPEKRINILSFPLLGILLWSALVYVREIFLFFRRRRSDVPPGWCAWLGERFPHRIADAQAQAQAPLNDARLLFEKRWHSLTAPIPAARLKSILHSTAFILAASAIGGMYVKGLANEYRAVWESTFFTEASQLRAFLELILGPAAALSGVALPDDTELNAMRWPTSEGENAARWIHWYAITIGLFVLIPRAILAVAWRLRANRLARTLAFRGISPLYFERILSTSTDAALSLCIVPYACELDEDSRRALEHQLEKYFGRAVALHLYPAIPFGEEESFTLEEKGRKEEKAEILPLFHFAATPEIETHLAVYQTLSGLATNPVRFVLLDATSYDRKSVTFTDAAARREGREAAWKRLFASEEVSLIPFSAGLAPASPTLS
jgi:hypothetical protein